jgi:flagellar basal-body rod protein FlgG
MIVGDFLRLYKEKRDELPIGDQTKLGAQFYHRSMARVPQVVESYTDFSKGVFQQTGNTLDLALKSDDLFFTVKTDKGFRLTKDGSFTLNGEGELVNKQGDLVLSTQYFKNGMPIEVEQGKAVKINSDGTMYVDGNPIGQLLLVQPQQIRQLKKGPDNMFEFDINDAYNPNKASGAVLQGALEKSNVSPVHAMVGLIETQRLVGMYQKVISTQMDDLNRDAIQKLGNVKA